MKKEQGGVSAPYFQHAVELQELGLCPIPCNGKKALIKWADYQSYKPYKEVIGAWVERFPNANIGILTGELYNLTVIDIDDPTITLEQAIDIFGYTPVTVRTPSGGMHLYYAYNGESNGKLNGVKGDIKATGGLVIVPPSKNPANGNTYKFIAGGWNDIKRLPKVKENALQGVQKLYNQPNKTKWQFTGEATIFKGGRNDFIFHYLKEEASTIKTKEELFERGIELNSIHCSPPLPESEIKATANTVWNYKTTGKLLTAGNHGVLISKNILMDKNISDKAFRLLGIIMLNQFEVRKIFAICPKAMTEITGWAISTIKKARNELLQQEYIELVYKGGKHKHDPNLYKLTSKGANF